MPGKKSDKSDKQSRTTAATQVERPKRAGPKSAPARTKPTVKKTTKVAVAPDPNVPRRLKPRAYKTLRLTKRIKHPVKLPSAWKITKKARLLIQKNWKTIGGIVLIYGILNILLVHGFNGGADVRQLKDQFSTFFHGTLGHLASGFSVFALLLTSSSSATASNASSAYQSILILVVSLALIWAFRQLLADKKIRVRDSFYRGMYPIVPFVLVLLVISLQLIPMLVGGWLFGIVTQNGIAITAPEKFLWGALFFALSLLSIYMICSSVFALYIVTLPDMTPMKALRSARELVRYRRWSVVRKVLFLPFILLIFGSLFMLPFILFLAVAAQWIFFAVTMFALAAIHAYMYVLYRELLNEKIPK
jgi:hypothetical protein